MKVLVTGSAGFIGFHLVERLLRDGHAVTGLDALTPYYDPALKRARLAQLAAFSNFDQHSLALEDAAALTQLVADTKADCVIHLAAQAGVRYSLEQPRSYIAANIQGTHNLLEALRETPAAHLLAASTSSIYGANAPPFREGDRTDHPVSIYAATKKAGEDLAHAYAHLFSQPTTMMRFFTVYGPWTRPDMALYTFARAIRAGRPIALYNNGAMARDFTYVADVVERVTRLMSKPPQAGGDVGCSPAAPYRAVNVASGMAVPLTEYVGAIQRALGRAAHIDARPMQAGDMRATAADITYLELLTGALPRTPLDSGVADFVAWLQAYEPDTGEPA